MKIGAGELRGRNFDAPPSRSVRPLSDKVRAAIFDVLGPIEGLTVLDVYAGSGAAGFEAVSRGAVLVEAIEANAKVAKTIQKNAASLGLDWGYLLNQMTVETWLGSPKQQSDKQRYGLIIADPPYAQLDTDVVGHLTEFLIPDGILVLSRSSKIPPPQLQDIVIAQAKTYGDTSLTFYKR